MPNHRRAPVSIVALTALLASLTGPRPALADDGTTLRSSSHAWFDGERQSGYLWGGAGVLSLGAAAGLHRFGNGSDVERGMAYPIAGFGLLQAAIGVGSLLRGSARADALDADIARSPEEARKSEIDRMRTLRGAFVGIEIFEAALAIGGVAFAATRTGQDQALARGVGLGLAAEGAVMLLLDSLAASRAERYSGQLDAIRIGETPVTNGLNISMSGVF
jgi:hypothetical protein